MSCHNLTELENPIRLDGFSSEIKAKKECLREFILQSKIIAGAFSLFVAPLRNTLYCVQFSFRANDERHIIRALRNIH